jgi:hypothetical protein
MILRYHMSTYALAGSLVRSKLGSSADTSTHYGMNDANSDDQRYLDVGHTVGVRYLRDSMIVPSSYLLNELNVPRSIGYTTDTRLTIT